MPAKAKAVKPADIWKGYCDAIAPLHKIVSELERDGPVEYTAWRPRFDRQFIPHARLCKQMGLERPPSLEGLSPKEILDWRREMTRLYQEALATLQTPPKKATGRRKNDEKPADVETLDRLCKWHGYRSGSVTNPEPATRTIMQKKYGLSGLALKRFLDTRGRHGAYRAACDDGTIGMLLKFWLGKVTDALAKGNRMRAKRVPLRDIDAPGRKAGRRDQLEKETVLGRLASRDEDD